MPSYSRLIQIAFECAHMGRWPFYITLTSHLEVFFQTIFNPIFKTAAVRAEGSYMICLESVINIYLDCIGIISPDFMISTNTSDVFKVFEEKNREFHRGGINLTAIHIMKTGTPWTNLTALLKTECISVILRGNLDRQRKPSPHPTSFNCWHHKQGTGFPANCMWLWSHGELKLVDHFDEECLHLQNGKAPANTRPGYTTTRWDRYDELIG